MCIMFIVFLIVIFLIMLMNNFDILNKYMNCLKKKMIYKCNNLLFIFLLKIFIIKIKIKRITINIKKIFAKKK